MSDGDEGFSGPEGHAERTSATEAQETTTIATRREKGSLKLLSFVWWRIAWWSLWGFKRRAGGIKAAATRKSKRAVSLAKGENKP